MHPHAGPSEQTTACTTSTSGIAAQTVDRSSALVFMVNAYVKCAAARIPVRIFLDQGSTLSFVKPELRRQLPNASPLYKAKLCIQAFSSQHQIEAGRFKLTLGSHHDDARVDIFAYEHDFGLSSPAACPTEIGRAVREFAKTHRLADPELVEPGLTEPPLMLVGMDQFYKIAFIGRERRLIKDIVARETRFGWTFGGPMESGVRASVSAIRDTCCVAVMSRAARDVDRLWDLDSIGVRDPAASESALSGEEESAMSQFREGLRYDGRRYTVALPKRADIVSLPNNKFVAIRRLENKLRELRGDPGKYHRYHTEITRFVDEGHAFEVDDFDPCSPDSVDQSYFMPHHAVVTTTETAEKWRIVFDCSSSAVGAASLNSQLLPGPNLNPDLVTLLFNFRLHQVAVSADIKSAYLCIGVSPDDGRYFQYLWRAPGEERIRCFQMTKVTWGATPSGFLLAATLREHFKLKDPRTVHNFGESLYYDDFLRSFPTDAGAIEFVDELQRTLSSASMQLAKWKTSSAAVAGHLISGGVQSPSLNLAGGNVLKVLGILWSPKEDVFRLTIQDQSDLSRSKRKLTKRMVLRSVASVFDPLGWLGPFTVRGRLLIRRLWRQDLRWDAPVPADAAEEFDRWTAEFRAFRDFEIPRQYAVSRKRVASHRLHVFADASQLAVACTAFIQYCFADGTSEFALIMCKTRLAPRDAPTLPRLELLAALMATRLKKFVVERMHVAFERVSFYTDSMIAYFWATSGTPGKWKVFVANRVTEIQTNSKPEEWFFVPGDKNIADLATRGISAVQLTSNPEWWDGPRWLRSPEAQWPITQPRTALPGLTGVQEEMRHVVAAVVPWQPLVDLERFSSFGKALRTTANVLRFTCVARRMKPPSDVELQRLAEIRLIRWSQALHFSEELSAVRGEGRVQANSKLASFSLFIDEDQLLRAKTRLTQGPKFSFDEKNPIIVSGSSRLAALLILQAHRVNAHFGVQTILSQLRRRFWITRARQIVKSVLGRCVTCRRRQAPPAGQVEGPLPPERAMILTPFASTGVDFAGPFYVRNKTETQKSYLAVFSCSSTRAVHLELVPTLSAEQTLLALRRFISSYPGCRAFVSDNGRSFVKAATDIKRLLNSVREAAICSLLADRRIDWQFNCPRAPWRGGFFEKVVGTVKKALVKTLGCSLISYEEFRTIIAELASVINDRPLTYVSADPDEPSVLTPAHFLRGGIPTSSLSSILPLDRLGPNGQVCAEDLRTGHRLRTEYFKHLSIRWYREYILQLRTANETRGTTAAPIKIGSVCLLKDDNKPRVKWNLVRVEETHPGRDGLVRTYTVRFSNGNRSRRAAQLLIPLEVADRT